MTSVPGISTFPLNFAANLSFAPQVSTASAASSSTSGNSSSSSNGSSSAPAPNDPGVNAGSILADYTLAGNPNLASIGGGLGTSVLGTYVSGSSTGSSIFGSAPTKQSQLLTEIAQNAQTRFTAQQNQITALAQQQAAAITASTNQWINVKASVNNAQAAVTQGQNSIQSVASTLLDMRGVVSNAEQDPTFNAQAFDADLASINNEANRLGPSLNLVGSVNPVTYAPNQVQYTNNINGATTTLTGGNIGSNYQILASDGSVWVPDLGSNTLTHYSELQGVAQTVTITDGTNTAELPETASYENGGIQLVSYNPSTQAITINVTINPSDPPTTVTGTLQQNGIGLMPAWFYGGLTTDAGRQQAFQAITEATARLSVGSAIVQTAANTTATDAQTADNALGALNAQNVTSQTQELTAMQALQTKYTQQVQAMQNNLSQLQSEQQNYVDAFASQISDDPFLSITV